jgi:primosomal protein N' (replication factor Y)
MPELFAEVTPPLPVDGSFTYRVPPGMIESIRPGARVLVPFGGRILTAFVIDVKEKSSLVRIKDIRDLLDQTPLIDPRILDLCRWISSYYCCPLGIVLKAALPAGLWKKGRTRVSLVEGGIESREMNSEMREIVDLLQRTPRSINYFERRLGKSRSMVRNRLATLENMGVLKIEKYISGERVKVKKRKVVKVKEEVRESSVSFSRSPRQGECFETLLSYKEGVPLSTLQRNFGYSAAVIKGLRSKGLVTIEDEEEQRDVSTDSMGIFGEGWNEFSPGEDQEQALKSISGALELRKEKVFLLHGVSGSGKTVVYIEAIKRALAVGRSAILLVPEIALTPQTVSRLCHSIDQPVALFHSALSDGERFDAWRKVRSGEYRIVVGARSAIFLPLKDLGLIVIDEEHESTYKQEEAPRYHAREVAIKRAELTGSVVILGSATPALESYWKARNGIYDYKELPSRFRLRPTPEVSIVDMREEPLWGSSWFISQTLGEKIVSRIEKEEQTILFLNRRGHSTFLQCVQCGWVAKCHQCDISMTYHRFGESLVCHYCFHRERLSDTCPSCQGSKLMLKGLGTEQVEEEVKRSFPGVRIARMDLDSTSTRGSHQKILERLLRRKVDVLIGTQMVTKGLDFPGITLVGVIYSDASLHFPDLRSSERTFQLLAQVAGRTGREGGGGEVILQTFLPDNRVLKTAKKLDYAKFAGEELRERREANYPPFFNLINVTASGKVRERVTDVVTEAAERLRRSLELTVEPGKAVVLGPAPCLLERIRGDYRWHFLFKTSVDLDPIPPILAWKEEMKRVSARDVHLTIDRDPISFA